MTRTSERSIITRTELRRSCQRRRRNNRAEERLAILQTLIPGALLPGSISKTLLPASRHVGLLAQVFQRAAADQPAEGDDADAVGQFLGDVQ